MDGVAIPGRRTFRIKRSPSHMQTHPVTPPTLHSHQHTTTYCISVGCIPKMLARRSQGYYYYYISLFFWLLSLPFQLVASLYGWMDLTKSLKTFPQICMGQCGRAKFSSALHVAVHLSQNISPLFTQELQTPLKLPHKMEDSKKQAEIHRGIP